MNDARAILAEVKAQRIEAEKIDRCLRELRKPWHVPLWSVIMQLLTLAVILVGLNGRHPYLVWLLIAVGLLQVIAALAQIRQRDLRWRELIEKRSPELARELRDHLAR